MEAPLLFPLPSSHPSISLSLSPKLPRLCVRRGRGRGERGEMGGGERERGWGEGVERDCEVWCERNKGFQHSQDHAQVCVCASVHVYMHMCTFPILFPPFLAVPECMSQINPLGMTIIQLPT